MLWLYWDTQDIEAVKSLYRDTLDGPADLALLGAPTAAEVRISVLSRAIVILRRDVGR